MTGTLPKREYPSAPIVGVGAIVIHTGNVLLVRRAREPSIGQWSLPGGAVELGETLEDAVVREVLEEAGLSVQPVRMVQTLDRIEKDTSGNVRYHYVLVDFLCRVAFVGSDGRWQGAAERGASRTLQAATDVSDAQWVRLEELRQSENFSVPKWTMQVIEDAWLISEYSSEPF